MTTPLSAARLRTAVEAGGEGLFRGDARCRLTLLHAITLIESAGAHLDARVRMSFNSDLVGAPNTVGEKLEEAQALLAKAIEQHGHGNGQARDELAWAAVNLSEVAMRQADLADGWDGIVTEHGDCRPSPGGGRPAENRRAE